jgi:hypothetical protein
MGAAEFGHLVRAGIDAAGLSQGAVGRRVTKRLADDRGLDATQVRLVMEGRRRLDHDLVGAFVEVLGLDPAEAWHAAGLWPPGLEEGDYRDFVTAGGTRTAELPGPFTSRLAGSAGRRLALVPDDQGRAA